MYHYKLGYMMYSPPESTEPDKYMAEVPSLPGCRAWGDTPEETLEILESVVAATIETYEEQGWELPDEVKNSLTFSESNEFVALA